MLESLKNHQRVGSGAARNPDGRCSGWAEGPNPDIGPDLFSPCIDQSSPTTHPSVLGCDG